jgi:Tfp pilus assembly protein PilO
MQSRLWKIIAVVLMVGIAAAGYFLGVEPQLAAVRTFDDQRASVEAQNAASRAAIATMIEEEKDLTSLRSKLADLQLAVPLEADAPEFIDDLDALATSTGVTVSDLTVAPAVPYVPPLSAVPAPDPAEPVAGDVPAETPATPTVPAAVTSPLITPNNLILIPVTISTTGNYNQLLDFVSGLQNGARLFLVDTFSSTSTSEGEAGQVTGTITGYIYVLLDQYDPAVGDGNAPTETPTP